MKDLKKANVLVGILLGIIMIFILFILGYFYWQANEKVQGKQTKISGRVVSVSVGQEATSKMRNQLSMGIQEVKSLLHIGNKLFVINQEELQGLDDILGDRLLIFHDEFDGDTLNPEYWNIDKDFNRNHELHIYCKDDVTVADGVAKIVARRNSTYNPDYQWTAGEFSTQGKLAFQNCRMEARIRMDNETGVCPAFWTLGETISGWNWPKCGEIDIFEVPHINTINCNMHFANVSNEHASWGTVQKEEIDVSEWHIYAMEVNNGIITIYLDGEQIDWFDTNQMEYYDGVNPFTKAVYPIFNIAVGGTASEGEPADDIDQVSMEIDWFRVYANEGATEDDVIPQSFEMKYLGMDNQFSDGKIKVGDSVQLFPVYTPQSSIQSGIVFCEVEDDSICTCSSGYITALKAGTTTITVIDSYGLQDTFTIEVIE